MNGAPLEVTADLTGDAPALLALASDAPLALEGTALEDHLVGMRDPRTALEAIRVWAFQEARNRQTTLTLAHVPLD